MENLHLLWQALDVRLEIFSGHTPLPENRASYERAYRCFRDVWKEVYEQEMKLNRTPFSDDFTRQNFIVTLQTREETVGLAFIRTVDLGLSLYAEDSFFRFWTQEGLAMTRKLSGDRPTALASYFTVARRFRNNAYGVCWKSLLLALFLEKFRELGPQIMITAARKRKHNEKLCYQLGAFPIELNVPFTIDGKMIDQEIGDLIYWHRDNIPAISPDLEIIKEQLWQKRIDLTQTHQTLQGVRYA